MPIRTLLLVLALGVVTHGCSCGAPSTCDAGTEVGCPCEPNSSAVACFTGPDWARNRGSCKSGLRSCDQGHFTECVGEVLPRAEVCDGVDNDCNGLLDDVTELTQAPELGHCTSPACGPDAGYTCLVTGKVGVCAFGLKACSGTGGATACQPLTAGVAEVCNGVDDDCNGKVDDALSLGSCVSDAGVGVCANGTRVCEQGVERCQPAAATVEACNGLDDDCNGVSDDHACAGQLSNFYCCVHTGTTTGSCVAASSPFLTDPSYTCRSGL